MKRVLQLTWIWGLVSHWAVAATFATGNEQIRFHNWWNYYERGVRRLRSQDVAGAAEDFQRCLGLLPGAKFSFPWDRWRVRTYGLHILEGYFPNREYGICLYFQGRTQRALEFLKKSLQQEPSARAKFYLNLCRARLLKEKKVSPPQIKISPDSRRVWSRLPVRNVEATISGEGWIADVRVGGERIFLELAKRRINICHPVHLSEGTNLIEVQAADLAGNTTTVQWVWVADWTPPKLLLSRSQTSTSRMRLKATAVDNLALARVAVDGEVLYESLDPLPQRKSFSFPICLEAGRKLRVCLVDRCGNTNLVVLSTESLLFSQRRQQLCALWADWYGLVASDEACLIGSEVEEDANAADQLPPALELVAPPCPTVEVTTAEYYLHGYTSDGGGIRSVRINGEKVFFSKAEETVRVDFARRLPLTLGTNLFEIRVDDLAGNVRKKTICVIRRKPLYLCTEYRTSIAIPPLYSSSSDPQTYPLTLIVQSWLQGALAREPVRFNLLEREEGWEYVLQEQRLSLSDLVDPRSALQIGRIVPAEILIMGSLFREGKGVTVLAKGVETSHGRILFTDDVYAEGERAELKYQVSGLALKIKQRFPLLMANIISIKGRRAVLDVGTNRGIGLWSSFIVISNSDGAATSPEVVKIAGDPVRLRVVRVRGNSCDTTIAPPQAARSISVECKAFTR